MCADTTQYPAGSKHMLKYMLNPKFCEHYFQGLMRKNEYFKKICIVTFTVVKFTAFYF